MSENNFISDEKFVPFLQSLGVETYNKSFEWLQSDTEIAGLLGWIYNNVDHNNALTAREECRYSELVKQGKVLSPEELEASVRHIQDEFKGICLPGDHDGLEDVKLDISQHTEKLTMLNKQEEILKELIQENQSTNQELTMELTKLSAAQQQAADDERSAGEECVNLAKQMKAITRDVVDTIADSLHMYSMCAVDKEVGKRFFTYIPFETYRQTQELFKMRVDSFMSLKFDNKHNDSIHDEITSALSLAGSMEARLSDAAYEYIESKVNLSGEEASLSVIGNYVIGQPIQYISRESHESAIQWLEQEVSILEQQIRSAVKSFAEQRTNLFHHTIANSELVVREQMYKELTFLHDIISEAVALDGLLYSALRRELHSAQELVYFASDLRLHLLQETEFIEKRIKSMHRTRMEQEQAENELQKSDFLLNSLIRILDGEPTGDPLLPVKLYNVKRRNIRDLNNEILYEYGKKEAALEDIKNQAKPLYKYIWDGCTKQPNRHNRSVSCLNHALTTEMAAVSDRVVQISKLYNDVKSGDENNFRKIWQWFLADPTKLLEAMRHPKN